uniref:Putative secreted protein n=1 Tax=Ixodes ricinus TaxID=34613 RepID=A0A6B0U6X5_IXORI
MIWLRAKAWTSLNTPSSLMPRLLLETLCINRMAARTFALSLSSMAELPAFSCNTKPSTRSVGTFGINPPSAYSNTSFHELRCC